MLLSKFRHRTAISSLLSLSLAVPIGAAAPKSRPDPSVAPGIQRERVFLVLVDVVVTQPSGAPVMDLRPEDFTLMVDGRTVEIQSVDLQIAGVEVQGATIPEGPGPGPPTVASGEAPPRGRDRARSVHRPRGIVLFFDGLNSEHGLGPEPIESARRFLKGGLQEGDEVMVMGLGRECRMYLNFTSDISLALNALDEMSKDPGLRMGGENHFLKNMDEINEMARSDPFAAESLARMYAGEDRSRVSRFTLALKALSEFLRARAGRKEIFLFTDGFPFNPGMFYGTSDGDGVETEVLKASQETASSQAALNTVNTKGLVAGPPSMPDVRLETLSTDTLVSLAVNSGGVATHGINRGFDGAMRAIEQQTRSTYVLSFTPAGEPDGKLHSTRVLVAHKGVRVRAPAGFVWTTDDQRREEETISAYFAPELFQKIPLALEAYSYLAENGKSGVDLAIAVPRDSVLFLPREGHRSARLEAGVVLKSADGKVEKPVRRTVELRFPGRPTGNPGDLTMVLHRSLPAGEYQATAVVRDLESGDVGALRVPVEIPPLGSDHLAMSSLILRSRASPRRWADLNPPVAGAPDFGPPAVRRIFTVDDQVAAFSLVYHPRRDPATGEVRVSASARVRRGKEVIRHLTPAVQRLKSTGAPVTLTMKFPLDFSDLEPGTYNLEVEAWDAVEGRGIVQHMEFLIRGKE